MNEAQSSKVIIGESEITFSKSFNAPRQLLFNMFRESEHLLRWWGPKDWKVSDCIVDFRPGGRWTYCLNGADNQKIWVKAVYHDIIEPELIVYTDGFVDPEGNPTGGLPKGITTVKFTEQDSQTQLTSHVMYESAEAMEQAKARGMIEGVTESWNFLEELLGKLGEAEKS